MRGQPVPKKTMWAGRHSGCANRSRVFQGRGLSFAATARYLIWRGVMLDQNGPVLARHPARVYDWNGISIATMPGQ